MTSCALATRQTQNTNAHSHTHTNTHTHTHTHTHAHEGSYTQLLNSVYRALNAMFPTKHEQDLVQHCKNGGVHAPPSAIPMAQRPPLPPPAATVNVHQAGADLRYAQVSRDLIGKRGPFQCQKRPIYMAKEALRLAYLRCASGRGSLLPWDRSLLVHM